MGQSAADDSLQHSWEAPSINTTDFIEADMAAGFQFDALFHIGTYCVPGCSSNTLVLTRTTLSTHQVTLATPEGMRQR